MNIKTKHLLYFDENNEAKIKNNQIVETKNDKITAIKDHSNEKVDIHLKDHILMPGFVNTHTHIPMSLFRGIADDMSLFKWLHEYIFPLEKKFLSADFVQLSTKLGLLECLYSGITSICDMYLIYIEQIGEVVDQFGLRAILGYGVNDFMPEYEKQMSHLMEKFKENPNLQLALAPHAPYTCSNELLKKIREFSHKHDLPIMIHVAETKKEREDSLKKYQKTPVQRMHELGITGVKSIFAHCVHVDDKDLDLMKKTNTAISHNPHSNMKLGSGKAPVYEMLQKGIRVGLGTDGVASNNQLNFFSEMKSALFLQKTFLEKGDELKAKDILYMASLGGAKALNMERTGNIKEGFFADLIAFDTSGISFVPKNNLISHLVYSSYGNEVDFVMCKGKVLLKDKKQNIIDEKELFSKCEKKAKEMREFLKTASLD